MDTELLSAAVAFSELTMAWAVLFALGITLFLGFIALFFFWLRETRHSLRLSRARENPILSPVPEHWWESEAVFNPAAVVHDGRVHLFYRALGRDGISRIGHASSPDGIRFDERASEPVYAAESAEEARSHHPYTSPARLTYDTVSYASGGGWGGAEDPRAVKLDGRIYMTFNLFNGWHSMSVVFTSLLQEHLSGRRWHWPRFKHLSRPGDRQKNWVLFPEKIHGKFAVFHNLDMGDPVRVHIAYLDELDHACAPCAKEAPDPQQLPDHTVKWHNRTRSAAAPPVKTPWGWLLLYHAMDKDDPGRYKVGALLLDLDDPAKVIARAANPVLSPDEWYENDWKPGIVYASGAVVFGDDLIVYYGGGDKRIAAARANLKEFVRRLRGGDHVHLEPVQ